VERSGAYRERKSTPRTPERVAFCRFFSTRGDFCEVLITQRSQVQILPPQPIESRGYVERRDPFFLGVRVLVRVFAAPEWPDRIVTVVLRAPPCDDWMYASVRRSASLRSLVEAMSYRSKTARVRCPLVFIVTDSGVLPRTMLTLRRAGREASGQHDDPVTTRACASPAA
jgi:hypothetical protein